MELIVITSTLGHVDIIGCGILASSIMEAGKYVLFILTQKKSVDIYGDEFCLFFFFFSLANS